MTRAATRVRYNGQGATREPSRQKTKSRSLTRSKYDRFGMTDWGEYGRVRLRQGLRGGRRASKGRKQVPRRMLVASSLGMTDLVVAR